MTRATLYSTSWCPYCRAAKSLLTARGIPFDEIDLTDDDAGRQRLEERTGRRTVPQIWLGETWVGGFDDLRALDRSGGLTPLLGA